MTKKKHAKRGPAPPPPEATTVTANPHRSADPNPHRSSIPVAHALPLAAAEEGSPGDLEPAVVGVAQPTAERTEGQRVQETMERLLGGLQEYDEERNKLQDQVHEAALRVRETHAHLKAALEPLTFAYGEEDGQVMFDTVLDDPGRFQNDKRPAIRQVAVAALAHDGAMHRAGEAQHRFEEYENKALPPALFRRVVNQRFKHLEDRMRQLEQLLFPSGDAAAADADEQVERGATAELSQLLVDDRSTKSDDPAAASAEEIVAVSTTGAPALVQHWTCEVRYGVRANSHDESFGHFVVAVSPVFPDVHIDADPEFNAIHQKRANRAQVGEFVRFLQHVMGERKMAMAMAVGVFQEDEEHVLRLLWADRPWTWLDEVAHNELQLLSEEDMEHLSEGFHVVLVGDPVPSWGEHRIKPARNQGFGCLARVLEELSQGGYFIRLSGIRGTAHDGGDTKHVQIFR